MAKAIIENTEVIKEGSSYFFYNRSLDTRVKASVEDALSWIKSHSMDRVFDYNEITVWQGAIKGVQK